MAASSGANTGTQSCRLCGFPRLPGNNHRHHQCELNTYHVEITHHHFSFSLFSYLYKPFFYSSSLFLFNIKIPLSHLVFCFAACRLDHPGSRDGGDSLARGGHWGQKETGEGQIFCWPQACKILSKGDFSFFPPQVLHLMGDLRLAPPVDDKVRKVRTAPGDDLQYLINVIFSGCAGCETILDPATGIAGK